MFELEKSYCFEAGHILERHDGKCKNPHGHNYELTIALAADQLLDSGPKTNMIMDFFDIDKVVIPMIQEYFDHCWLNDTLGTDSSTVEFMAKWIFDYLSPQLPALSAVILSETPSAKVTYRRKK